MTITNHVPKPVIYLLQNESDVLEAFIGLCKPALKSKEHLRCRKTGAEILRALKDKKINISKQTVYNSIKRLVKHGFLKLISSDKLPGEKFAAKVYELNSFFYENHSREVILASDRRVKERRKATERKQAIARPLEALLLPAKKKIESLREEIANADTTISSKIVELEIMKEEISVLQTANEKRCELLSTIEIEVATLEQMAQGLASKID